MSPLSPHAQRASGTAPPREGVEGQVIAVDRVACVGRGVCAELAAGRIHLDEWGYPIESSVILPTGQAARFVTLCPARALYKRP